MQRLAVALVAVAIGVTQTLAADGTALDPIAHPGLSRDDQPVCSVYIYTHPMGEVDRLEALGYSVTVGSDLSLANISGFDVVFLSLIGAGVITEYQDDLDAYVQAGGGLMIQQPNAEGAIDYAPTGCGVTVSNAWWCEPFNTNTIVELNHPTMLGLTAIDLPARYDGVLDSDIGPQYTIVARGTGICRSNVCAAVAASGNGQVYLDLGSYCSTCLFHGSDTYVRNVLDWLCQAGPEPTVRTTWGQIKTLYR